MAKTTYKSAPKKVAAPPSAFFRSPKVFGESLPFKKPVVNLVFGLAAFTWRPTTCGAFTLLASPHAECLLNA